MKNKGLTIVLVAVVGIIWYKVFFRVKSNLFGEETSFVGNAPPKQTFPTIHRDTFKLNAGYRDPFSGALQPVSDPSTDSLNTVKIERSPAPVYIERWPEVVYYGLIRKTNSKEPLAIIKIDGMQFYLRAGDNILDDYVIKKIYRDSVEVVHGKRKRVFRNRR